MDAGLDSVINERRAPDGTGDAQSASLGIDSPRPTLAAVKSRARLGRTQTIPYRRRGGRGASLAALPAASSTGRCPKWPNRRPSQEPRTRANRRGRHTTRRRAQPPPEEERLLEAALAQLPEGLVGATANSRGALATKQHRQRGRISTGIRTRGRPTGVFRGDYRRGGRVNILATLRAARPGNCSAGASKVKIRIRHAAPAADPSGRHSSHALSAAP